MSRSTQRTCSRREQHPVDMGGPLRLCLVSAHSSEVRVLFVASMDLTSCVARVTRLVDLTEMLDVGQIIAAPRSGGGQDHGASRHGRRWSRSCARPAPDAHESRPASLRRCTCSGGAPDSPMPEWPPSPAGPAGLTTPIGPWPEHAPSTVEPRPRPRCGCATPSTSPGGRSPSDARCALPRSSRPRTRPTTTGDRSRPLWDAFIGYHVSVRPQARPRGAESLLSAVPWAL